MSRTVSATEARIHLGELLDDVERNDAIMVEQTGAAEAVILPLSEFIQLGNHLIEQDAWRIRLRKTRQEMRKQLGGAPVSAAELIRQGREERDEQLLDVMLGC